jgi:ATP-dependent Clp protease, protease subunit
MFKNNTQLEEALPEDQSLMIRNDLNASDFYFYNEVNIQSVFQLNKFIADTEKLQLINKITFDLKSPPPIKVYINSDGGEIFSAFTAIDRIKSCKVPVYTFGEGMVASAATLISISGKKRFIRKNTVMLVHQLRSWVGGTHENIKDEAKNLQMLSDRIISIYLENTKFNRKTLEDMFKHDVYLNAKECIKYGLADEII